MSDEANVQQSAIQDPVTGDIILASEQETGLSTYIPLPGGVTLPDYIPDYIRQDLIADPSFDDGMDDYLKIPRLAIVQKMTPNGTDIGPEGTVYLSTTKSVLWVPPTKDNPTPQPPIVFTPCFFWPEVICWNPRGNQGLNAMRERTTDKLSELFRRGSSRNAKDRRFVCPDVSEAVKNGADEKKKMCVIQKHLNFIIYLYSTEYHGVPMLLSFSRTSYYTGEDLINSIKIRQIRAHAQYYGLDTHQTSNNDGEWATWRTTPVIDHASGMLTLVPEDMYAWFGQERDRHAAAYKAGMIQTEYDESENATASNPTGPSQADVAAAQARY